MGKNWNIPVTADNIKIGKLHTTRAGDHQSAADTVPKPQILDSSKLKEFANDIFKFDVIGKKFSKRVENTVGNGAVACYEQFLLFLQCFQIADT